jgi:hypothetical protein
LRGAGCAIAFTSVLALGFKAELGKVALGFALTLGFTLGLTLGLTLGFALGLGSAFAFGAN